MDGASAGAPGAARALARPCHVGPDEQSAEEELAKLWAWGQDRGYTPTGAAQEAGGYDRRPAVAVDPRLAAQQRLIFSGRRGGKRLTIGLAPLAAFLTGVPIAIFLAGARSAAHSSRGLVALAVGLVLWVLVFGSLRSRTMVDAQSFHVRFLRWRHAPWPPSRSDLFILLSHSGRRIVSANAMLLLGDGGHMTLHGLQTGGVDPAGPLRVLRWVDQVWAWGELHGAARDDGAYHVHRADAVEQARASSADRLARMLAAPPSRVGG